LRDASKIKLLLIVMLVSIFSGAKIIMGHTLDGATHLFFNRINQGNLEVKLKSRGLN
jgi:hypothetical protein